MRERFAPAIAGLVSRAWLAPAAAQTGLAVVLAAGWPETSVGGDTGSRTGRSEARTDFFDRQAWISIHASHGQPLLHGSSSAGAQHARAVAI